MSLKYFIYLLLFVLAVGCTDSQYKLKGHDYREIVIPDVCQDYEFAIISLPNGQLPNRHHSEKDISNTDYLKDDKGIPLFAYKGDTFYHPTVIIHKTYPYLTLFEKTGDSVYLSKAELFVNKLLEIADVYDSALYFPFEKTYFVHQNENNRLDGPWYSGMPQGEALSVFSRLYRATGDSLYLDACRKTMNSFFRLKGEAEPWTVFVDDAGCYWIEEYPTEEPSRTLNGFIFSIYGLYDYYEMSKREDVKAVLVKSISTIKNYIPCFRRDSLVSFYNLTFRHYASNYHYVHIDQLRMLSRMTGDLYFDAMADTFQIDFNKEKEHLFK